MSLGYDEIQNILKIIDASTLEEVHLETEDFTLSVRRRGAPGPAGAAPGVAGAAGAAHPAAGRDGGTPAPAARVMERPDPSRRAPAGGVEVKAPMVGTFYRAPAPGAPPFVEVGSVVTEDDTVCILEVMKLMNSIRAGCRGRVVDICAENGALVEFGQTLMVIEPLA